jgi:hypothetical protein
MGCREAKMGIVKEDDMNSNEETTFHKEFGNIVIKIIRAGLKSEILIFYKNKLIYKYLKMRIEFPFDSDMESMGKEAKIAFYDSLYDEFVDSSEMINKEVEQDKIIIGICFANIFSHIKQTFNIEGKSISHDVNNNNFDIDFLNKETEKTLAVLLKQGLISSGNEKGKEFYYTNETLPELVRNIRELITNGKIRHPDDETVYKFIRQKIRDKDKRPFEKDHLKKTEKRERNSPLPSKAIDS